MIYMHPRCSLIAWESLARETGLGVASDNRGRIHLSSEPLAYHPPELSGDIIRRALADQEAMILSWLRS